jgi:hypothetical protein
MAAYHPVLEGAHAGRPLQAIADPDPTAAMTAEVEIVAGLSRAG